MKTQTQPFVLIWKRISINLFRKDKAITNMTMKVTAKSPVETELEIMADTTFMGRLGELGQPIIRRKARNTLEEFSQNLITLMGFQSR